MSVIYLPSEMKGSRAPSFVSLNKEFTLLKPGKSGQLLRGPRRVVRLCVFAFILPAILITVPLYVRLMLYPPAHYPMMPTDQRLLSRHASSFWCQAQSTHMNGSFNSYLTKGKPDVRPERRTYVMLNHIKARDDVKEYWGFYLLKGSTVTISSCARWAGGQLLILRGVENLHRCAWIGEEDSAEDMAEDDDVASNERHRLEDLERRRQPIIYQAPDDIVDPEANLGAEVAASPPQAFHSEERRHGISKLLRKALKISKNKKEILRILHSEGKKQDLVNKNDDSVFSNNNTEAKVKPVIVDQLLSQNEKNGELEEEGTHTGDDALMSPDTQKRQRKANRRLKDVAWREARRRSNKRRKKKKGNTRDKNLTEEEHPVRARLRRQAVAAAAAVRTEPEDMDGAFEELDTDDVLEVLTDGKTRKTAAEEMALGTQVFFPEGLKFERGKFNQTTAHDNSREEQVSSYSSSEEALASCEGVIISLQLVSYRQCNYQSLNLNKISYDIPITGTYYFVFSSDNEIYVNDLFFNVTLERVVYNVSESEEMCTNSTDCIMPLSFWSDDQTVVEVPPEATWDHFYVMDIKCEPRIYVYLAFLLLVPIFIMCCALH